MYRVGETVFQISVENPAGINRDVEQITLDGKVLNSDAIPLLEDGAQHQIDVVLGAVLAMM
jgi:cyclic beta-1,2-glucan synthetase